MNILLNTDSYKLSHFNQYPFDTTNVSSYIEARGGRDESVFFGLQAFIKKYLTKPITQEDIDEYVEVAEAHGVPSNRKGWEIILNEYGGLLPVTIQAVPEGTVMPTKNVQVQVVNTDPRLFWLTSYLETAMLRAIWYPSTVATMSREYKKVIKAALEKSSDVPVEDQIGFKLHDFGARGATSEEAASLGGMAHLVNFMGTDTLEGIMAARKFYNADMAGFSIPATEHSTMTSWGRENETKAYENVIIQYSGEGKIYACVSDSYDIYNAVENIWGSVLKEKIIESGGTLVVRPDSGDPLTVPVEVLEMLSKKFGYTYNSKGYKVLPPYIRVIQGDGLNAETLPKLIDNVLKAGFSLDNIAFGMGGGLLQNVNRDTLKYAMKASARMDNHGVWHDVYKDPIHGGKTSKKGRLGLMKENGVFVTKQEKDIPIGKNLLQAVYHNGEVLVDDDFETVRSRASV